jgi:hypothetical protein
MEITTASAPAASIKPLRLASSLSVTPCGFLSHNLPMLLLPTAAPARIVT